MTTSMPRPGIAPVLTATAAVPPAPAGVQVTTTVNIALLQQEHPGAAPDARAAPAAGVRAAYGPLVVDGIVFPGPRFGS